MKANDVAIPMEGYLACLFKSSGVLFIALSRQGRKSLMSTLILKRIGSRIIAGDNTAKKMLAWTEAKKKSQDEFDMVFEEDDDFEENISEIKNLTDAETECLYDLVKMLSLIMIMILNI